MNELHLDLETYSDVDLLSCGVYKYAESENFEILLFGYSVDGERTDVIDLTQGEKIPIKIITAIVSETVIKWAHNASFERVCLSAYIRKYYPQYFKSYSINEDTVGDYLDPESWRCSMVWSAYLGLPLSLKGVGSVLKLDAQKMDEGKELIRYFCVPCKPTKTNGGRTRNLPCHAPDKWALFKEYNKRDVEVEMGIQQRLHKYSVPDFVWDEYHLDQEINDRGIGLDMELVEKAIHFDEMSKTELSEKLSALTQLENPNSVAQMKQWLCEKGLETDSLDKAAVNELLKTAPPELRKVLVLRQQLAKSSVKKYTAMKNLKCNDGRARGCFQFYGANRTGRWAGRYIQLQNLAKNFMPDLEQARELVKQGNYEAMQILYENIPDVLSQLIRTALVPRSGYKFVVADFSAIEARVIAHLAGERWRTKVFKDGGDIYCASASQMFHVPVVKHGINGELRQKGKVAELACIAEGELVLTNNGLIPIEKVSLNDKLWDGEEWVTHDGVIYKGEREVITYDGLTATEDHLVFIEGKQRPIQFGTAAACGAHLIQTGNGRTAIRLGENSFSGETMESKDESLLCSYAMHRVRQHTMADIIKSATRSFKGLSALFTTEKNTEMARQKIDGGETKMRKSPRQRLQELWSKRHKVLFFKCNRCRPLLNRDIRLAIKRNGNRPDRQQQGLCTGEYKVCYTYGKQQKQEVHGFKYICTEILALLKECGYKEIIGGFIQKRDNKRCRNCSIRKKKKLENNKRKARLYDIRNAGRNHRFTVSGKLVHNCGYGGGVGAMKAMGGLEMGLSEDELQSIVTDWRSSNPNIVKFWWDVDKSIKYAIKNQTLTETHGIRFVCHSGMLFITLPSGRNLSYVKPQIGENRFGGESVTYMGLDAQKKWARIESYGPKFVENIVQAISRDILCYAMKTLSHCFIVAHIHDELIIECSENVSLAAVCEQMGRTPPWIKGLLLNADGYECMFYRKD